MIRDIIDRFSYRFALWRRQELTDYFPGRNANLTDVAKLAEDPKRRIVLIEPTVMLVARGFVTYFGIAGSRRHYLSRCDCCVPGRTQRHSYRFDSVRAHLGSLRYWSYLQAEQNENPLPSEQRNHLTTRCSERLPVPVSTSFHDQLRLISNQPRSKKA